MASLAGYAMTRDETIFKIAISLDLNILRNIWDNVSTQVKILGYFNKKIIHIVPLMKLKCKLDFGFWMSCKL